jgi:hypothetical protein
MIKVKRNFGQNLTFSCPVVQFIYCIATNNRHALLNSRKFPVYSNCRLCQQTQTLNLLVVVQGQCTMGCAADESEMEKGFQRLKTATFG